MKKTLKIALCAVFTAFIVLAAATMFAFASEDVDNVAIYGRTVCFDSSFKVRYLINKSQYDSFVSKSGVPQISYVITRNDYESGENETPAIMPFDKVIVTDLETVTLNDTNFVSFFVKGIAPKDIDAEIHITISHNDTLLDEYSDSVCNAMKDVVSGDYSKTFSDAAKSVLEYGQAAAVYFGKNSVITESDTAFVGIDKFSDEEHAPVGSNPINIIGTSLILQDELSIRFWAEVGSFDMSEAKIIINGIDKTSTCNLEKNKGTAGYYVFSCSCAVDAMEDFIEVSIENANGERVSNIYRDSVVSYCVYVVNNAKYYEKLVPLAEKILNYIYYTNLYLEDMASPAKTFTVTFIDWDGTELKKQTVKSGESATPPQDPAREGFAFTGWSGNYTNVTANIEIVATYIPCLFQL